MICDSSFLPLWRFWETSRKNLLKYKNDYTTWTIYILKRSKFSTNCVKKYDKLKLNYPDIRPSHVQLREPNYKIKERFHQLDKPTTPPPASSSSLRASTPSPLFDDVIPNTWTRGAGKMSNFEQKIFLSRFNLSQFLCDSTSLLLKV